MTPQSPAGKTYTDILTEFSQGMNSGVLPQLLPKSQSAFAINTTFRGAFATHRPPYVRIAMTFPSNPVKTAVESGFYQGGGWYRPDTGPLQIVAQISGRLFTFTKQNPGNYIVAEITVPGDPNDPRASQVWMWQSEKWLIITDGSPKFPIFYDGSTSRRSLGPSRLLATGVAFNPAVPPAIGSQVVVTLSDPYVGNLNVPVLFHSEHYQIISAITTSGTPPVPGATFYNVTLVNLFGTAGNTVPSGSDIVSNPSLLAYIISGFPFGTQPDIFGTDMAITHTGRIPVGTDVQIRTTIWRKFCCNVSDADPNQQASEFRAPPPQSLPVNGDPIFSAGNSQPSVVAATTSSPFAIPAQNASVVVSIKAPFGGNVNDIVWIGMDQFRVSAIGTTVVPPTPGAPGISYLTLQNLSDVSVGAYVNPSPILSLPELPAGRMGTYGMGQTWMSLTDGMSFIASDPVGFSSGLPIFNYRDAVLRTTGADSFLAASGGSFRIPTSGQIINSMTFTANLDTSLGQGNLQVGTDSNIFSCLAPFDYTATALPPVILTESLIGFGPLAQNSTIIANSDLLFRSFIGLGSLILARRQFEQELTWGNTPISREMTRVFTRDNEALLPYGSAVVFDNRLLDTCSPNASGQGTFHLGLVALNFDLVSSLRGKAPPVYDGMWTGLNALQIINIQSGSEARAFIFGLDIPNSKIELYELLKTEDRVYFDNGVSPIRWIIETPVLFNQDVKPLAELVRITNGEIWVQDIVGTVNVVVWYRPDFYSGSEQPGCWERWTEFEICATAVGENVRPAYRTRIGLGEPSGDRCQDGNNRPFRVGHFFQFKIEFIGSCKFMALRVESVVQPQADFAPVECDATCLPAPTLPDLVIP